MRTESLRYASENCTIGRAMEVLGEKWTVVVLREVFLGIRRFDDMWSHTGIPRQVLTNRLARLVDEGILRRVPYRQPGERARDEYRLTAKGLALYPVLVALKDWGDRYVCDPEGPPMLTVHRDCGASVHSELRCEDGHDVVLRDVIPVPGPGIRPWVPAR
jgi:DNA-binding HxlR family transcriptional regulator